MSVVIPPRCRLSRSFPYCSYGDGGGGRVYHAAMGMVGGDGAAMDMMDGDGIAMVTVSGAAMVMVGGDTMGMVLPVFKLVAMVPQIFSQTAGNLNVYTYSQRVYSSCVCLCSSVCGRH